MISTENSITKVWEWDPKTWSGIQRFLQWIGKTGKAKIKVIYGAGNKFKCNTLHININLYALLNNTFLQIKLGQFTNLQEAYTGREWVTEKGLER